jgi:hypothetical protein
MGVLDALDKLNPATAMNKASEALKAPVPASAPAPADPQAAFEAREKAANSKNPFYKTKVMSTPTGAVEKKPFPE